MGLDDSRVDDLVEWIVAAQWPDGVGSKLNPTLFQPYC
jgi:hypothetical protein